MPTLAVSLWKRRIWYELINEPFLWWKFHHFCVFEDNDKLYIYNKGIYFKEISSKLDGWIVYIIVFS